VVHRPRPRWNWDEVGGRLRARVAAVDDGSTSSRVR
jgi:hypothetical protein